MESCLIIIKSQNEGNQQYRKEKTPISGIIREKLIDHDLEVRKF